MMWAVGWGEEKFTELIRRNWIEEGTGRFAERVGEGGLITVNANTGGSIQVRKRCKKLSGVPKGNVKFD